MNELQMQYPYGNDELYDGQKHIIEPIRFLKIPGGKFYIMEYYDRDELLTTIITRVGNSFAKVPLHSYDELWDFMDRTNLEEVYLDVKGDIKLAETMCATSVLNPPTDDNKTIIPVSNCVATTTDGKSDVENATFTNGYVLLDSSDFEMYSFSKQSLYKELSDKLKEGLAKTEGDGNYHFLIEVPPEGIPLKKRFFRGGRVYEKEVLVVPGIYEYDTCYAPYDNLRYSNAINSEEMEIQANIKEYRDLHDADKAFKDAGQGKLLIRFLKDDRREFVAEAIKDDEELQKDGGREPQDDDDDGR